MLAGLGGQDLTVVAWFLLWVSCDPWSLRQEIALFKTLVTSLNEVRHMWVISSFL